MNTFNLNINDREMGDEEFQLMMTIKYNSTIETQIKQIVRENCTKYSGISAIFPRTLTIMSANL